MDKSYNFDWLNKDHWYNTSIFSRLHGSLSEDFTTISRNDRYNLLCYFDADDKKQTACEYDESSLGDKLVPKNATTEALEALVDTPNFIDMWLKPLEDNY